MFKKILLCTALILPFAPLAAKAGGTDPYLHPSRSSHTHPTHYGPGHGPHPNVVRGYYPTRFARGPYGPYGHHGNLPSPYRYGYGVTTPVAPPADAAAASQPEDARTPFAAYRSATALVPVTTYEPVPVRVYYIPQQQPYYNVPPYAVREPCFCN
jgi:hypothetical protein